MVAQKKKNTPLLILIIIFSLALMLIIKSTFIFLIISILPAIVASFSDLSSERKNYKIVSLCNFAGTAPYICELIAAGNNNENFYAMLIQPKIWFTIYLTAGVGWFLIWSSPLICKSLIEITQKGKIIRIEMIQKKLIQEWGNDIQKI